MQSYSFKFIAPNKVIEAWDVSRSFLWRLEKAGHIKPAYLYSRKLYSVEEIQRVEQRIANGELRTELRGAARPKGTIAESPGEALAGRKRPRSPKQDPLTVPSRLHIGGTD